MTEPELFPVICPCCGARLDHDGIGRCSRVTAALRARVEQLLTELNAALERTDHA